MVSSRHPGRSWRSVRGCRPRRIRQSRTFAVVHCGLGFMALVMWGLSSLMGPKNIRTHNFSLTPPSQTANRKFKTLLMTLPRSVKTLKPCKPQTLKPYNPENPQPYKTLKPCTDPPKLSDIPLQIPPPGWVYYPVEVLCTTNCLRTPNIEIVI